eukprot:1194976-Prorocentrum_minimum.AAC.1
MHPYGRESTPAQGECTPRRSQVHGRSGTRGAPTFVQPEAARSSAPSSNGGSERPQEIQEIQEAASSSSRPLESKGLEQPEVARAGRGGVEGGRVVTPPAEAKAGARAGAELAPLPPETQRELQAKLDRALREIEVRGLAPNKKHDAPEWANRMLSAS